MKKVSIIMYVVGALLLLLDVDNMSIFFASKVIGLLCIVPMYFTYKTEE